MDSSFNVNSRLDRSPVFLTYLGVRCSDENPIFRYSASSLTLSHFVVHHGSSVNGNLNYEHNIAMPANRSSEIFPFPVPVRLESLSSRLRHA